MMMLRMKVEFCELLICFWWYCSFLFWLLVFHLAMFHPYLSASLSIFFLRCCFFDFEPQRFCFFFHWYLQCQFLVHLNQKSFELQFILYYFLFELQFLVGSF